MPLQNLIKSENVLCNARARSKKQCLEILSELLAQSSPDIANEEIFSRLIERERLGCTGLSRGVALPHCRVAGATRSTGALIKLSEPVDFDASDGELVDLVFGIMVPEELSPESRPDIAKVSALLADENLRARLRAANSSRALYEDFLAAMVEADSTNPNGSDDSQQ
ncbi:MAG: PTS sugar transporter subunit IIA [Woeseiaceae bacterium]